MIIINKGKAKQLLELSLGVRLSSTNMDFEDSKLKTNKCDASGNPGRPSLLLRIAASLMS